MVGLVVHRSQAHIRNISWLAVAAMAFKSVSGALGGETTMSFDVSSGAHKISE